MGRVIREDKLGLTHARLRAIAEANGDLLVWCDDDNLLSPDYLENAIEAFRKYPRLGIAGGKSIPEYLEPPQEWYRPDLAPLGCRDHGDLEEIMSWMGGGERFYPSHAPIGAGMVTRQSAIKVWADLVAGDRRRTALGRTGASLTSGEDNDINLVALGAGWDLGYLPQLSLAHVIPPGRLTLQYQKRIARASFRDFVKVLDIHSIRPWSPIPRWSIPLRSAKAWLTFRVWRGPVQQIGWQSAIGQFEGRAALAVRK
jgi:glycosyltransferase involved in cell wall biosynthesis